ncbi:hypothetical protein GMJAKD_02230 [Candidatus Electrothrix aarhusensis]
MKIIKPLNLSLLYKHYEEAHRNLLTVSSIAFFSFDVRTQIDNEINLWKFTAEELGKDAALDLGMPKPRSEVLVTGKFFAPGGKPVPGGKVRLQLGSHEKTLYVFGDRFWKKKAGGRLVLTDPSPITSVDLSYTNAFGGLGYAKNPLGKGYFPPEERSAQSAIPLPNITDPKYPISSLNDTPDPAGFGPYDLTWPQRFSKVGTYDEKWLSERFPGYAEDFDPTFFNTAPEDQQLQGFFKGDETFSCENMHPEKPMLHGQLPGIRPRCFINRQTKGDTAFQEIPLRLDTVWLFPHAEKGILIFRGSTEVQDDTASDVSETMLAYERMGDTPRELSHYQQALTKRLDEEKGYLYALNEKDLIPEGERSAIQELLEEGEKKSGEGLLEENMKKRADLEVEKAKKKMEELGLNPDDYLNKAPEEEPEITLDNLDELDVITDKMLKKAQDQRKAMEERAKKTVESMGLDYDELLKKAKKQSGGRIKFSAEETIAKMQQFGLNDPETEKKLYATEEQVDNAYRQFGHYFPPAAEPSEEQNEQMRASILDGYKTGASFAGMEFTGVDLAGLDLHGINFQGAFLEGANLSGTNLSDADLSNCMLARSKASGARFTNAKMTEVNLGQADLTGADFRAVTMEKAVLAQAKLTDACFKGAVMVEADLFECKGKKANMSGADLREARCIEGDFEQADFSGSNVSEALFLNTKATKINFTGAQLVSTIFVEFDGDGAIFANADMTSVRAAKDITLRVADFRGAKLIDANLRSSNLWGSNFEKADLSQADLSECDLEYSIFYRAIAKQTMFMKTDLTNADMTSINLFEGSLQKAKLENTDLSGSNLFAADLLQADFTKTLLKDANIQRTLLSKWSPS